MQELTFLGSDNYLKIAETQNIMGSIYKNLNEFEASYGYYVSSIVNFEKADNTMGMAYAIANLANLKKALGFTEESLELLTSAESFFLLSDNFKAYYKAGINKADLYLDLGMADTALFILLKEKKNMSKFFSDTPFAFGYWLNYLRANIELKNLPQSELAVFELKQLFTSVKSLNPVFKGNFLYSLGKMELLKGNSGGYEQSLLISRDWAKEHKLFSLYRIILNDLMAFYVQRNDFQGAVSIANEINSLKKDFPANTNPFSAQNQIINDIDFLKLRNDVESAKLKEEQAMVDLKKTTNQFLFLCFCLVLALFSLLFAISRYLRISRLTKLFRVQKLIIESTNKDIVELNVKLEQKVEQRTKSLLASYIKLKEYAFLNSQKLGTPVKEMLSVNEKLKLKDAAPTNNETQEQLQEIFKNLDYLEATLTEIQQVLIKERGED
ncbi:MAG: hypothetical protein ACXITV_06670 [Luteibaculaceae bacterium]